jgi:hypothetical protein
MLKFFWKWVSKPEPITVSLLFEGREFGRLSGPYCLIQPWTTTMIDEAINQNELAFLAELEKHENEWIAFVESHGVERVVGSGKDAVEAMTVAKAKGFPDAVLLRVPPFDRGYIPSFPTR